MKLNGQEFKEWNNKAITLLGMSGVGKTRLSCMLRQHHWFHYSGDYRIGTRYLDEPILDNIKQKLMHIPLLKDLMRTDSLRLQNNITVDNLNPVSSFLGKLGNPENQGLGLTEFKYRQELHRQAEIASMQDVPKFIHKARNVYGYDHLVNDAGGSLCELEDAEVFSVLSDHTLILYIQTSKMDEQELIKRAENAPKPLYYRESFLDAELPIYMLEKNIEYIAQIEPDDFVRWVFPRLFYFRIPRYEAIAEQYGYTIKTEEIAALKNEADFLQLISDVLDR